MESWLVKWMSQGIPNFSTLARECPIITGLTDLGGTKHPS